MLSGGWHVDLITRRLWVGGGERGRDGESVGELEGERQMRDGERERERDRKAEKGDLYYSKHFND